MKSFKSILPLLALLLATSGCREKGTLRIIEAVSNYEDFFSDSCPEIQSAKTLSFGRLDVSRNDRNAGYTTLLRVASQENINVSNAASSSYQESIIIKNVETYFTDEAGADIGSLPTAAAPNVFATGGVIVGSSAGGSQTVITAPLMRASDVVAISGQVPQGTLRVLANIKVWAELESGYPVDSFVFTFPIEVCRGCLYNIGVKKDPVSKLPLTPITCEDPSLLYLENEGVLNGCSFLSQEGPQEYCQ